MKKSAIILLKLGVTAALLAWLLAKVEVGTFVTTIRMIPAVTLVLAAALFVLQPLIAALRWHLIMRYLDTPIPLSRTLQIFWIGQFATVLLPGGVAGDGIRMWILARAGARLSKSINSVLLDRICALIGLFLLVAASLPFVDDRVGPAPVRYALSGLILIGIGAGLGVGLFIRLPAAWQDFRLARAALNLSGDLRTLCMPPGRMIALVGLSALTIAFNALTIFILLRGLGAAVAIIDCMALAPLIILVTTLPVSLGGWGLREGSTVGLFQLIGVAPAVSFVASIVLGLLATAVSLPGVLVWLQWRRSAGAPPDRAAPGSYPAANGAEA